MAAALIAEGGRASLGKKSGQPTASGQKVQTQNEAIINADGPSEAYNRKSHYGKTPTESDRRVLGAGKDEVVDHQPELVKRYYEGDPAIGEKPGYQMTQEERKQSGQDRTRMQLQPKAESNSQGGKASQYSKQKKAEHGL
jgi:hypothetical protein